MVVQKKFLDFIADMNDDNGDKWTLILKGHPLNGQPVTKRQYFLIDPEYVLSIYKIEIKGIQPDDLKAIKDIINKIPNINKSPPDIASVLSDLRAGPPSYSNPSDDLMIS